MLVMSCPLLLLHPASTPPKVRTASAVPTRVFLVTIFLTIC
jgi:hypothetical protein